MIKRTILISALFALPTIAFADDSFADLDPDFDTELEDIQNSPTAKDETKNERREASFNALDEEEEFEMNLSEPAVDANNIADPDAELEPLVESDTEIIVEDNSNIADSNVIVDIEEIIPTTVDAEAKDIEWNLDLDEDIEIGDKKISSKEVEKSEPVDLDFLDEE
jgi:hypothetical protein